MQLRNFYIVATIRQTKHNIGHYSKISPLALTHLRSLSMKDSTLAHTCSCCIFSHSRNKACFRSARLRYFLQLTLSSNIDHIEKSSRFKSGDEGGHSSGEINPGKFALHHSCVAFCPVSWC